MSKYVKTNSTFWFLWSFTIPLLERIILIVTLIFQQKYKTFDWGKEEETQISLLEKNDIENRDGSKL